ncbi:hypothetical protein SNEBB_002110 [Seison nebaliae]|nr:hypothetical protein SNEBB_002110 [Seison nebaliae]
MNIEKLANMKFSFSFNTLPTDVLKMSQRRRTSLLSRSTHTFSPYGPSSLQSSMDTTSSLSRHEYVLQSQGEKRAFHMKNNMNEPNDYLDNEDEDDNNTVSNVCMSLPPELLRQEREFENYQKNFGSITDISASCPNILMMSGMTDINSNVLPIGNITSRNSVGEMSLNNVSMTKELGVITQFRQEKMVRFASEMNIINVRLNNCGSTITDEQLTHTSLTNVQEQNKLLARKSENRSSVIAGTAATSASPNDESSIIRMKFSCDYDEENKMNCEEEIRNESLVHLETNLSNIHFDILEGEEEMIGSNNILNMPSSICQNMNLSFASLSSINSKISEISSPPSSPSSQISTSMNVSPPSSSSDTQSNPEMIEFYSNSCHREEAMDELLSTKIKQSNKVLLSPLTSSSSSTSLTSSERSSTSLSRANRFSNNDPISFELEMRKETNRPLMSSNKMKIMNNNMMLMNRWHEREILRFSRNDDVERRNSVISSSSSLFESRKNKLEINDVSYNGHRSSSSINSNECDGRFYMRFDVKPIVSESNGINPNIKNDLFYRKLKVTQSTERRTNGTNFMITSLHQSTNRPNKSIQKNYSVRSSLIHKPLCCHASYLYDACTDENQLLISEDSPIDKNESADGNITKLNPFKLINGNELTNYMNKHLGIDVESDKIENCNEQSNNLTGNVCSLTDDRSVELEKSGGKSCFPFKRKQFRRFFSRKHKRTVSTNVMTSKSNSHKFSVGRLTSTLRKLF